MVHLNLQEQDQVRKIRYFWHDYGRYVIGILVVAIVAYISSSVIHLRLHKAAQKAAILYSHMEDAWQQKNDKQVFQIANELTTNYSHTQYAILASMLAANKAMNNSDGNNVLLAKHYLQWAIDNGQDKGFVALARLRLAKVLVNNHEYSAAINLLKKDPSQEFKPLYYELCGDIYLLMQDNIKARAAYEEALQAIGDDAAIPKQSLQFKLDLIHP